MPTHFSPSGSSFTKMRWRVTTPPTPVMKYGMRLAQSSRVLPDQFGVGSPLTDLHAGARDEHARRQERGLELHLSPHQLDPLWVIWRGDLHGERKRLPEARPIVIVLDLTS